MALGIILLALVLYFIKIKKKRNPVSIRRILPERLSNGDENAIRWQITNYYPFRAGLQL
jgi:hypothetical protein